MNEDNCDEFFITEQKRDEYEKGSIAKELDLVHPEEHVNDEEKLIENEGLEEKA